MTTALTYDRPMMLMLHAFLIPV